MLRFGLTYLMCLLTKIIATGQTTQKEISIFFKDAKTDIDLNYSDNKAALDSLDQLLGDIVGNPEKELVGIEIQGLASPSGTYQFNQKLSERRAKILQSMIMEKHGIPAEKFTTIHKGIDYDRLVDLLREDGYKYADEVITIIEDQPAGGSTDTRKSRLMNLRGGRIWREMMRDYFPDLCRSSALTVYYVQPAPEPGPAPEPEPTPDPEPLPPVYIEEVEEAEEETVEEAPRNFYMSVHTNMLYDVAAVPNVGAEFYLSKNISIAGNWWYAWWKSDRRHRYLRTYGGYIAPRYWFGKAAHAKSLTGHHIGLYGQIMLYDFEWGRTGYLSGTPGKNIFHHPTWGGGSEYGFALPIARHLNLDFTIGVGYLQGRYWKYEPMDGHYVWMSSNMRHWFGPTKLEVSLVWLLGRGNVNEKKGVEK